MVKRMTVREMLSLIRNERINTWFDLGLYIDKFKENNPLPTAEYRKSYRDFKKELDHGGLAFITFHFAVDGVTVEVEKYAKIFRKNFQNMEIHYIAGRFYPESEKFMDPACKRLEVPEIRGFDNWELYNEFYFTKLERGSREYNELIKKFWKQVLTIVQKISYYIEENGIQLLYLINVCSNPGNVSLALAIVLIAEYLGIPVINNNHDFYWEGGNRQIDKETKRLKKGPRDFFFTNSHVGEFFSVIETIFPWESRSWLNVNINQSQVNHIIRINGHNPANVALIGTAVDTDVFINIPKRKKINAFLQFEKILSRYEEVLIAYSVNDVIHNNLVERDDPKPILMGWKTKPIEKFSAENIIFLQPTRIISRKRIELGFRLIRRLFQDITFLSQLKEHLNLKITMVITGPIAAGQYGYFEKLIKRFSIFLESIKPEFREKIFLACLFSELDKESFKKRFDKPVGIPELYNIASLILLPSKTEGRGLPIIEASACGIPIICRRYDPKDVFKEVIGEHLEEKDRLRVIEFDGKNIKARHVQSIIDRIFYPNKYMDEVLHNRKAVIKRYSLEALNKNIKAVCYQLYLQLKPNDECMETTRKALERYRKIVDFRSEDLNKLLRTEKRQYLPGYGRLSFMIFLKSLIDPSYFRVEQQAFRGIALNFAREIITKDPEHEEIPVEKKHVFYNAVDNIFYYRNGEIEIRHDHSMSYRHRNKNYYPYQDFTIQELTGVINLLYNEIISPKVRTSVDESPHFFTDWNLALSQLTASSTLAIDDREKLMEKMHTNLPVAYFPGDYLKYELEFFVLQSVRSRLKLSIEEELTEEVLDNTDMEIAPVYVFAQDKSIVRQLNKNDIIEYIKSGKNEELRLLYHKNILRIVSTEQLSVGIHFAQLGEKAIKVLRKIQEQKGYIISNRRNAVVMTDIVDIDRFHIGKVQSEVAANILGIPLNSGYIQFAPAGVRTTIAYPTPIQTAKDFSELLKSKLYSGLCRKYGEEYILDLLRKDAEMSGSPLKYVLENIEKKKVSTYEVPFSYVSGVYNDGHPWNGVVANININQQGRKWKFITMTSKDKPKKVNSFVNEFQKQTGKRAGIAWNGGYILNPELVGKLGLPESYIGSPLGLIITDQKVISPPLFNKAALLIDKEGKIRIERVNSSNGIVIEFGAKTLPFNRSGYNCANPSQPLCYYDLLYDKGSISGEGRVIVRLAGNVVKEVIFSEKGRQIQVIPVGLTLSIHRDYFPENLIKINAQINIRVNGLENVKHAIEAGPMLLNGGELAIDMELGGWKTHNSISTQAARLDFTDMRGPKIAAGIDKDGNLSVLTVNGRIRESVGATHQDMADIMKQFGITCAMGFDPGGSSTLVVNGEAKNISPYNKEYEKNVYSLPPEPRAVSNVIIGYIES